jgi:hypothetical protein
VFGNIIDCTFDRENVSDSTSINREFDSNEIDETVRFDVKHPEPMISISHGISSSDDVKKVRTSL